MTRQRKMDDLFERLLPSASQEQIEGARLRILGHVRSGATAEPVALPLSRLNHGDYHILLVLSEGERHGYAIMAEVSQVTEGATRFGPGTLYTSIKRLVAAGVIEESGNRPDPKINHEPRRYYRLTGTGQRVLAAESERLAQRLRYAHDPQFVRSL
jgi:DNA-binding PadR family transcriptional regulator